MSILGLLKELESVGLSEKKIAKAIGEDTAVKAAVIAKAKEVEAYWKSIAPVSDRGSQLSGPGDYKKSIKTRYKKDREGKFYAQVYTRSPIAHFVEYGTSRMPEQACAARTVEHFHGHRSVDEDIKHKIGEVTA